MEHTRMSSCIIVLAVYSEAAARDSYNLMPKLSPFASVLLFIGCAALVGWVIKGRR
jgi:hypothetical protein